MEWSQTTWWFFDEFPDCAITYQLTMSAHSWWSEWQNIIDRTHTWQLYAVTISEDILTKCCHNLRWIAPLNIDNNTNTLAGDWRQGTACRACVNWSAQSPEVRILNKVTYAGSLAYASDTLRCMTQRGRGYSLKQYSATYARRTTVLVIFYRLQIELHGKVYLTCVEIIKDPPSLKNISFWLNYWFIFIFNWRRTV